MADFVGRGAMARRNKAEIPGATEEVGRLAALERYRILDTPPEPVFDRIAELAARLIDVPIAYIALIDGKRQWFKASVGLNLAETPREDAVRADAIAQDRMFVVKDAREDPRFKANPLVAGEPGARFYAGAPMRTADGHSVGTLCVIDRKPRALDAAHGRTLEDLAAIAVDALELRLAGLSALDELGERRRLEEELRRVADTDALTGLANRRAAIKTLAREFRRARRHGHALSVLVFDLDRFKAVNDTHGHAAGDAVLQEVARRAQSSVRGEDTVGRIGGEEFVAVLPETGHQGGREAAERLRAAIGRVPIAAKGHDLRITVSIGVATLDPADEGHKVLLARADEALYEAKQAGRDRVVTARPPVDDS